jgi:hypothetical protein
VELAHLIVSILGNTQLGVVSSILTMPILAYIIKNQRNSDKDAKKRDAGIQMLLQCQLADIHNRALECRNDAELLPEETIENFFDCYRQYKEMGGNGYADRMKQDIDDIRAKKLRS